MKCPKCHGTLKEITVYEKTYLLCNDCEEDGVRTYWTPELKEIEDIVEYKNEIRRKALKKLLGFTDIHEDQE